ncbi:MAG: hypothetical protein IJ725_01670, partial [Ruminococcus sp.]|nr:hypothetical protein [Ruminococcus sp.]
MKTYYIKRISVLLAILMIFSAFPITSASAMVSPDYVTYLDATFANLGVEDWYAWTWNGSSGGRWVMGTEVSDGCYSFENLDSSVLFVRADKSKTIGWDNGSVYNQTEDLENHTADYYYKITAWNSTASSKMQGEWVFTGPYPTDPTVTVEE